MERHIKAQGMSGREIEIDVYRIRGVHHGVWLRDLGFDERIPTVVQYWSLNLVLLRTPISEVVEALDERTKALGLKNWRWRDGIQKEGAVPVRPFGRIGF